MGPARARVRSSTRRPVSGSGSTGGTLGAASWSYEIYYDYASRAVRGEIPYRDYLVEYPILSFPLFLIPRLVVSDLGASAR